MTWVATATLAVSAYTGHQASKANNELSEQNRDNAVISQTYDNRSLNERQREEDEVTADKKLEARIAAMKAKSTLQAQGKNIDGNSMDSQRKSIDNSLGRVLSQLDSNSESQRRQLDMSKKGTTASAQSRINSVPKTKYDPTADIAGAGLSIYGGFKSAQREHGKTHANKLTAKQYAFGDWG